MKKFLIILVLGSQFTIAEDERLNHVPNIKLKMLDGKKIQFYEGLYPFSDSAQASLRFI